MADVQKKVNEEKAGSKKRNRTGGKAKETTNSESSDTVGGEADESKTVEPEPEAAAEPQTRWRSNGAEHLKAVADKLVARNCERLAEKLLKKAMEGRTDSTRLLVTLAEGKKPRKAPVKKPRLGASVARALDSEPEWTGTEEEENRE